MRVAQMLDSLRLGGAQRMQVFLVETLAPLGVEITVISLRDSPEPSLLEKFESAGARVVCFPFRRFISPGSFISLVDFIRREKFDLIHAYLTYSNIIGPLAGRLTGTPSIASLRNVDTEGHTYTPQREFLEDMSLRYLATRVTGNGQAVAEEARRRVKNRRPVDIIPNAVDLIPAIPVVEREKIRQEILGDPLQTFIISVGRLTQAKGFHDLIDAFAFVHNLRPSASLVIAGGGKMHGELQDKVNMLGLQDYVNLLGPRTDVPRLLASADIYVNSSHWEGTPVSVLEAMAAGLPVIATRVGENPYLLEPDAGILVDRQKPARLAEAMLDLLSSEALRLKYGQAARERIRQVYSREQWCKTILSLYSEITPKAQPFLKMVLEGSSTTG